MTFLAKACTYFAVRLLSNVCKWISLTSLKSTISVSDTTWSVAFLTLLPGFTLLSSRLLFLDSLSLHSSIYPLFRPRGFVCCSYDFIFDGSVLHLQSTCIFSTYLLCKVVKKVMKVRLLKVGSKTVFYFIVCLSLPLHVLCWFLAFD